MTVTPMVMTLGQEPLFPHTWRRPARPTATLPVWEEAGGPGPGGHWPPGPSHGGCSPARTLRSVQLPGIPSGTGLPPFLAPASLPHLEFYLSPHSFSPAPPGYTASGHRAFPEGWPGPVGCPGLSPAPFTNPGPAASQALGRLAGPGTRARGAVPTRTELFSPGFFPQATLKQSSQMEANTN